MKVEKKRIGSLSKCYALAKLRYHDTNCFLVAAEKRNPCYLYAWDGTFLETVWEGPGGVMTMEQVPGSDGEFLATQAFYSPNDSAEARIVLASPQADGWSVRTLCQVPFVHRFGILTRNSVRYLIVCCLKSGHAYRDDWRFPGATYGAVLPEDLSTITPDSPLQLELLLDGMLKNHGFSKYTENGEETAIVACDTGVFQFLPPETPKGKWEIRQLLNEPSSDAVLADFDGDGVPELGSITPFHGDTLRIYKRGEDGRYRPIWQYPEQLEFLHATWIDRLFGKPTWFVGNRKGERLSMAISWNEGYQVEIFDRGAGAANAMALEDGRLVMANRETDEVALYTFSL